MFCLFQSRIFSAGNQTLLSETLSSASSMVKKEKIKSEPVGVSDGLVTYQGAVLDVANLLQRVEKGDHDRITSEKKIQDLEQLAGMYFMYSKS